jgi:hypothetical protein
MLTSKSNTLSAAPVVMANNQTLYSGTWPTLHAEIIARLDQVRMCFDGIREESWRLG